MANDKFDPSNAVLDRIPASVVCEDTAKHHTRFRRRVLPLVKYERVHMFTEYLTFLVIIVGAPLALLEYYRHNTELKTQYIAGRYEIAREAYTDVDIKYREFLRLCLDHPRLDCYSVSAGPPDPPLTKDEKLQQKILYTELTDVLEDAYLKYVANLDKVDAVLKPIFQEQWKGWDMWAKKFITRLVYCQVYLDIRDEFDIRFDIPIRLKQVAQLLREGGGRGRHRLS
jgi:hypothetical protein